MATSECSECSSLFHTSFQLDLYFKSLQINPNFIIYCHLFNHDFLGSRLVLPCPIDVHLGLKYFINYLMVLLGKPVLFWDVVNSSTYIQRTGHEWKLIDMFGPLGRENERKPNKQKRSTKVEAVCFSLPCITHF